MTPYVTTYCPVTGGIPVRYAVPNEKEMHRFLERLIVDGHVLTCSNSSVVTLCGAVYDIPENGGHLDLPDGSAIEVEALTVAELFDLLPRAIRKSAELARAGVDQICAAYNAGQVALA